MEANAYSRYWTGTSLRLRLMRILGIGLKLACNGGSCGKISFKRVKPFAFEKPSISFGCKLVPVYSNIEDTNMTYIRFRASKSN